jgi:hypothetical protein
VHVITVGVIRRKRRWQWRTRAETVVDVPGLPAVLATEGQSVRLWVGGWMSDPAVHAITVRSSVGTTWRLTRRTLNRFLAGPRPRDPE